MVNAGHGTSARGELQNGADAAALAGARELNGRASGVAAARQVGAAFAALHDTDTTRPITVSASDDVRFCNWAEASHSLRWCLGWGVDPTDAPPPVPTPGAGTQLLAATAVQVRDGREASRGNALPVWFSPFVGGVTTMDARASATALGGGPCETRCVLPIAYIDCAFAGSTGVNCGGSIIYRNDNDDTAGFTNLNDSIGGVGNPEILDILNGVTGAGSCLDVHSGDVIDVKNGNVSDGRIWNILRTLVGGEYSVPVVHSESCKLNQQLPVVGFATLVITGVYRNSRDGPPAGCADSAGRIVTPCITATITCDEAVTAPAGCGFFGLLTRTSRLVQ